MTLNLISDTWIPVRRRSGVRKTIAPWQITSKWEEDPVVSLDSPRADFNGSLIQFLIGLLQTAVPPETERDWRSWFFVPPSPEKLQAAFSDFESVFTLAGTGPRFMQDLELTEGTESSVASLLIETPGVNTELKNTDLFIKRGRSVKQCFACLAMALYNLQTNASSGGKGHRTSLRGGGPLSTVVVADTLWGTAWVNVLPKNSYEALAGDSSKRQLSDIFPWLAPCRTSEIKTGRSTTPLDVHPLQMYWGMPRRIRVNLEQVEQGACEVCGKTHQELISSYLAKSYGTNYEGAWQHPLSPYGRDKDGMPHARHPQPDGLVYRHWLGLVVHDQERDIRPASVVSHYISQKRWRVLEERLGSRAPSLWCFGYDMDNMKARCWYESRMPLVRVKDEVSNQFAVETSRLIKAADSAAFLLRTNLKKAWYKSPGDVKGDLSMINSRFWQETESGFYEVVEAMARSLEVGEDAEPKRREWLKVLRQHALSIFDDLSQSGHFEAVDPKRLALARRDLNRAMHPKSKKMAQLLALSQEHKAA